MMLGSIGRLLFRWCYFEAHSALDFELCTRRSSADINANRDSFDSLPSVNDKPRFRHSEACAG